LRLGLDTDVLVHAHLQVSKDSEQVRRFLRSQLQDTEVHLYLSPLVLHEFLHIVTDPRRFEPPVATSEAVALARSYLNRSNVECLAVDEQAMVVALRTIERENLGRKRIADTLFAATLVNNGVSSVATCNPADFAGFEDLRVIDPRR
jgi:predicted nucleic acid-binding protein